MLYNILSRVYKFREKNALKLRKKENMKIEVF